MLGDVIRQIRLDLGWSVTKMASEVGVTQESVSNWEANRNKMPLDRLERMAEVTGFPVSYMLGEDTVQIELAKPISAEALPALHRKPVWTRSHGWALVNQATKAVTLTDGGSIPFDALNEDIFALPPALSLPLYGFGTPLTLDEIPGRERVWVEPIGADPDLNTELRGWYHPRKTICVANEFGIRLYLDTYGAKWLAFDVAQEQGSRE